MKTNPVINTGSMQMSEPKNGKRKQKKQTEPTKSLQWKKEAIQDEQNMQL